MAKTKKKKVVTKKKIVTKKKKTITRKKIVIKKNKKVAKKKGSIIEISKEKFDYFMEKLAAI